MLVVVFEGDEGVANAEISLLHAVKGLEVPMIIRPFALKELQKRFGLQGTEGG